jgi:hypothetical protein
MLFEENPRPRRRSQAFTASVALHCVLVFLFGLRSVYPAAGSKPEVRKQRAVLLLRLQEYRPHSNSSAGRAPAPQLRAAAPGRSAGLRFARQTVASEAPVSNPAPEHTHRQFELPPTPRVDPVKQTLVQLDVPPDIQLKHDIPLPTALLWMDQPVPPPMRKRFVAPPMKQLPKAIAKLPTAQSLQAPNQEVTIADLKLASVPLNDMPKLVHLPAKTAPIKSAGTQPVREAPQIILPDPNQADVTALISLPDSPVHTDQMVVIPPANQIAPSQSAGGPGGSAGSSVGSVGNRGGAPGAGSVAGNREQGLSASSSSGSGFHGAAPGGSHSSTLPGTSAGTGSASAAGNQPGTSATGSGFSPRENGAAGNGTTAGGTGVSASGNLLASGLSDVTQISLPKAGKFSVVVMGSAAAGPYTESIGALSGKMVYTVYLSVGFRKKWILEYCLPKTAEQKTAIRGRVVPLEAPWPFFMLRPNHLDGDTVDYLIVHGILNADGTFEQLAMIFPQEFEKKDLLMNSLKQWAFRPASRDGEPTAVEVLLIIPNQTE